MAMKALFKIVWGEFWSNLKVKATRSINLDEIVFVFRIFLKQSELKYARNWKKYLL